MESTLTFITGHTGGLGRQVADSLNENEVLGIARTKRENVNYRQLESDISNYNSFEAVPEGIFNNQKVNIVLCAGQLGRVGGIENGSFEDWERTFKVNVLGNTAVIYSLLPQMIKTGYGRIVFIAGGGAAYGYPLFSGYALSKVAIVREVENIAIEMKDKIPNFSIIALATGAMDTPMLDKVREAGAEIRTTVDIQEPVDFIKRFLNMEKRKAVPFSGRFLHVRDNMSSRKTKDKWLLRRME